MCNIAFSIEHSTDQLFLMDINGQIHNVNSAACQALGYQREELLGKNFAEIDQFLSVEVWDEFWNELENKQQLHFDSQHSRKNGTIVDVSILSRYIDLDGKNYICSIVKTANSLEQYYDQGQEEHESLKVLFEHAAVGMARLSPTGEFLQVNDALCRIIGYSREQIIARVLTLQSILKLENRDFCQNAMMALLAGEKSNFSGECQLQTPEAQQIWVNLSLSLVKDVSGMPLYFIGTFIDITLNKLNEESQKLAAAVLAHTHDGIMITDSEGTIQAVNPAFVQLTGYLESEVLGHNPRLLKSGRHTYQFYQDFWHSLKTKGHWRGEIWNRNKTGEVSPRMMTVNVIGEVADSNSRYVAIFSDISQLKESEAHLEFLAHHDSLTGLANRRLLEYRVEHALEAAERKRENLAILMIDLDHFKEVNDRLGHAAGDELLKIIATRLKARLRNMDTLARLGGDEFAVLLENPTNHAAAEYVAQAIMDALSVPVYLESGEEIFPGASVGISFFPHHGKRYSELMQQADRALYRAKGAGRRKFCWAESDFNHSTDV